MAQFDVTMLNKWKAVFSSIRERKKNDSLIMIFQTNLAYSCKVTPIAHSNRLRDIKCLNNKWLRILLNNKYKPSFYLNNSEFII